MPHSHSLNPTLAFAAERTELPDGAYVRALFTVHR
jgi:hypothetical protein